MNTRAAKKPTDEEEVDPPEGADDDDGDDDDGDDDEDDDDDDDDVDDEDLDPHEAMLKDVCQALRDALETQVSVTVDKKRILLDTDDDRRWLLTIKSRD